MTIRSIFGLLLGLLLQVSLVVPSGACVSVEQCEMQASACSCCKGGASCPCASSSTPNERPRGPVAPPARPLKVDAVAPPEVVGMLPVASVPDECALIQDFSPVTMVGYSGVGLSISLCRLVI